MTSKQTFQDNFKKVLDASTSDIFLKKNKLKKETQNYSPKNYKEKIVLRQFADSVNLQKILTKNTNIYIIGAGGTTSWFLPKLIKILNIFSHEKSFNILIVDGDIVESKNLTRQNFIQQDIGKYKAEVLATRYSNLIKDPEKISISFINKYVYGQLKPERFNEFSDDFINFEDIFSFYQDIYAPRVAPRVVFNLVDNEGVKKDLDLFFNSHALLKIIYFSAGVNLHNGQIYTNFYLGNLNYNKSFLFNSYSKDHDQYLEDYDTVSLGCAEANENEIIEEQLINGNDIVASALATSFFNAFYSYPTYKFINLTFSPAAPLTSEVKENYLPLFLLLKEVAHYSSHRFAYFIPKNSQEVALKLINNIFYKNTSLPFSFATT